MSVQRDGSASEAVQHQLRCASQDITVLQAPREALNFHVLLGHTTTGLVWNGYKIVCHVLLAITVPKARQTLENVLEELSMMY